MKKTNYSQLPLNSTKIELLFNHEVDMINSSEMDYEDKEIAINQLEKGICNYINLEDSEFDIVYKITPLTCPNKECNRLHLFPTVFFIEKDSFNIIGVVPNFDFIEDSFPRTMYELTDFLNNYEEDEESGEDEEDDFLRHLTNNN